MPEETTQTPETTQTATTETTQTSAEGTQTQTADPAPAVTEQTLLNQGEQQAAEAAAQVPESYEAFTDAQGNPVSNDDFKGFTEAAKSVGLSQENAQKMFSAMYGEADNYVRRRTQEFAAQWAEPISIRTWGRSRPLTSSSRRLNLSICLTHPALETTPRSCGFSIGWGKLFLRTRGLGRRVLRNNNTGCSLRATWLYRSSYGSTQYRYY